MARFEEEVRITPSVLDRLIDYEPEVTQEPIASRSKSLRQLKQSVKRDLEWLLNTRQVAGGLPPGLKETNRSLAAYGLPDFTTISIRNEDDQELMRRAITTAIKILEPRLEGVTVTIEPLYEGELMMHFRIDARLKVDPAPEAVTFDTVLDPIHHQYVVQGD